MPRAFTDADIVQQDTGTAVGVSAIPFSLPNPTEAGTTGVIVNGTIAIQDPPEQWHAVAPVGASGETSPQLSIMCRADLPAGETAWQVTIPGGNAHGSWWIAEWRNIAFAPLVAYDIQPIVASPASIILSAAQVGANADHTLAVAAVLTLGAATAGVWSTISWSGGFTETHVFTRGDGTSGTNGDYQLRIARRYGAQGETGPWAVTATYDAGTQTNKTAYGALAVFRAANYLGDI